MRILNLLKIVLLVAFTSASYLTGFSLQNNPTFAQDESVTYRLYPTQNMNVFIKLNTRNGLMWLVQYSTSDKNRIVDNLNTNRLVALDDEQNNRFTLIPTQNIWTFILLDQIDGGTWQVQWSIDAKQRFVLPIK
jgi:hypothetical protein